MGGARCPCGQALRNGEEPNDIELWVYTYEQWQNICHSKEITEAVSDFNDYIVWRCFACKRILARICKRGSLFHYWKEISQENPELLKKTEFTCKCGKFCSSKPIPPEYQLQLYTDWEIDDLFNREKMRSAEDIPPSKYHVWGCPDCRQIYAFNKGESTPFAIYEFEE